MRRSRRRVVALTALLALVTPLDAQPADTTSTLQQGALAGINWVEPGGTASLGTLASFTVPKACKFTAASGAKQFLTATENVPDGDELGVVACTLPSQDIWFAIFSFDQTGYIKDTDKNSLDADAILSSIRKGTETGNAERRKRGWSTMDVLGWSTPPYYDAGTNNLTWALRGRSSDGHEVINHSVRLLGRYGVMKVQVVMAPDAATAAVATFDQLLSGYQFLAGNRYSEWRVGDKVAEYGLTALIAGGAGAALVKTGALGKLWKLIGVACVAVFGAIRNLFTRKRPSSDTTA